MKRRSARPRYNRESLALQRALKGPPPTPMNVVVEVEFCRYGDSVKAEYLACHVETEDAAVIKVKSRLRRAQCSEIKLVGIYKQDFSKEYIRFE
jgi:hypothetical protein